MSKQTKWKDLLTHRVLVVPSDASVRGPFEYIVREVSPSGHKVKLENRAAHTFWCDATEYDIEEDLGVNTTKP